MVRLVTDKVSVPVLVIVSFSAGPAISFTVLKTIRGPTPRTSNGVVMEYEVAAWAAWGAATRVAPTAVRKTGRERNWTQRRRIEAPIVTLRRTRSERRHG